MPAVASASLTWPGRSWWPGASITEGPDPPRIETEETFGESSNCRLIHGDSLDVARALGRSGLRGAVDLVYVDPPFASQASYSHEARLDGPADGRVERSVAYLDSWPSRKDDRGDGVGAYLDMLAPRLEAMAALLAPTGSLWVHVDWRASYLVRVLLDEILGRGSFLNEIVWRRAPNLGRQAASGQFGRTLDTIVVYGGPGARLVPPTRLEPVPASGIRRDPEGRTFTTAPRGDYTDESMARLAREGRVHHTASGKMYVKYFLTPNADGELCRERRIDTLWTDVPPLRHARVSERTGFPTQKPQALLERIIACASPAGGTVVDLFAGSGTTGVAAHALGRRCVLGDKGAGGDEHRARSTAPCGRSALGGALRAGRRARRQSTRGHGSSRPLGGYHRHPGVARRAAGLGHRRRDKPGGSFVATWHSERHPGPTPVKAAVSATLAPNDAREVRVYADDGSVGRIASLPPPASAFAEAP